MSDGYVGLYYVQDEFAPPTISGLISLTDMDTYVQMEFDRVDCDIYSIYRSYLPDYSDELLVGELKDSLYGEELVITFIDDIFSRKTTIYYRVFVSSKGIPSTTYASGNITVSGIVADVSSVASASKFDSFVLTYSPPKDRRYDGIQIKVDAQVIQGNLNEINAVECYVGTSEEFTYKIPNADLTKYHQFWIYTVTRE
jgi:hypothetical protein